MPIERAEDVAGSGEEGLPRIVIAEGLETIASAVPAGAVGWYPVSSRGEDAPGAVIATSQPLPGNPETARLEYLTDYHRSDPFAPRRFLDSSIRVVTMSDIGGRDGLLATRYGSELLPEFGIEHEAALYVRNGDRILGAVRVGRSAEQGDVEGRELAFLRRVQRLLEAAYVLALEATPALRLDELLDEGLTRRQAEVARLAATGATNAEIAARLAIGEATVKTHLLHVFEKLDVRTRTELAVRLARSTD